jgi:2-haloacid dehalogenase
MRPDLLVFDVNETLLDLTVLGPQLQEAVGEAVTLPEWFARMLHRSLVANHLGRYEPFGELGAQALVWLAARAGVDLAVDRARAVVAGMERLPPHPDVVAGLEALMEDGHRMVALTNGSTDALAAQLTSSGLGRYFERAMSVDAVGRFKPAPEVYLHAAAVCGVDIDRSMLVAAHDWDVAGARSVGAMGCFVARPPWGIAGVTPSVRVPDLVALAPVLQPEGESPRGGIG